MDKLAAAADKSLAVVSSRDLKDYRVSAAGTEFHKGLTHLMHAAQYKALIGQRNSLTSAILHSGPDEIAEDHPSVAREHLLPSPL